MAVIVAVGLVQVNIAEVGVTVTVGVALSSVITTLAEAVHPLVPVPTTVYVPVVEIVAVAIEAVKPPVLVHE